MGPSIRGIVRTSARIGEDPDDAIRTLNIPPPSSACGQRAAKIGAHGKAPNCAADHILLLN